MKVLFTSAVVFCCFIVISCSKHSTPPAPGSGPSSLFPLVQGSTWYYLDSANNDTALTTPRVYAYLDTVTPTKVTIQDNQGTVYLEINDPNGWFVGSYIAVDPSNNAIYEADSPAYQPYTFFAVVTQDGQTIGTGQDNTNPACPLFTTQVGYVTTYTVGSFTNCLKNVEYTIDCNNNPQEQITSYVLPGTGVVRIEHWMPDSTTGPLFEDYSQTLQSYSK